MFVRLCVRALVRLYVCTFMCLCVWEFVHLYVCTFIRLYVCAFVRVCVCVCASMRMWVCAFVRLFVCAQYVFVILAFNQRNQVTTTFAATVATANSLRRKVQNNLRTQLSLNYKAITFSGGHHTFYAFSKILTPWRPGVLVRPTCPWQPVPLYTST